MSLVIKSAPVPAQARAAPEPRQRVQLNNLAVGAFMNVFQVTTLGQPMEVLKTHVAANRHDSLRDALRKTWARGGFTAFYQGLIPWAWMEASTKGAILILTSTEVERWSRSRFNASPAVAGVLGGIAGGAGQAYLTMGKTRWIGVTRWC
jgi:hypothetical protein